MGEIRRVKVQGHVCPDCGSTVLREVTTDGAGRSGDQSDGQEHTAGYMCAAHCGWEIRGPSLPL